MFTPKDEGTRGTTRLESLYWTLVVLTIVAAMGVRAYTFFDGWVGIHNAWGGAFYGNIARNFVRYGFIETAFAPVTNTGMTEAAHFDVYYHHPVLSMWVTGVSFKAFGVHEWSGRLAPLAFSLFSLVALFTFARDAFGKWAALVALMLAAAIPVDAYYAAHLDPYGSMAIFFTLFAVVAYWRWTRTGATRRFLLCCAAIVLGCWTSWFTYFIVPGLLAHGWISIRNGSKTVGRLQLAALPALTVCVFAAFMMHRAISLPPGPEVYDSLLNRLLMRTVNLPIDRVAIMRTYTGQLWSMIGPPMVLLTVMWLGLFIRDLRARTAQSADWCVGILLSFGLLYAIVFPGHLPAHDYFVRAYAPGVALAGASVITRIAAGITSVGAGRMELRARAVAASLIAITGAFGLYRTWSLYRQDNKAYGRELRGFGEAVTARTAPTDTVFAVTPDDRVLAYYVDRPMRGSIDTPAKVDSIARSAAPFVVVVTEIQAPNFPGIVTYLGQRFETHREKGIMIFAPRRSTEAR